jgi:hypothetical protein
VQRVEDLRSLRGLAANPEIHVAIDLPEAPARQAWLRSRPRARVRYRASGVAWNSSETGRDCSMAGQVRRVGRVGAGLGDYAGCYDRKRCRPRSAVLKPGISIDALLGPGPADDRSQGLASNSPWHCVDLLGPAEPDRKLRCDRHRSDHAGG